MKTTDKRLKNKRIIYYYSITEETPSAFLIDSLGFGKIWIPKSKSFHIEDELAFTVPIWLYEKYEDEQENR